MANRRNNRTAKRKKLKKKFKSGSLYEKLQKKKPIQKWDSSHEAKKKTTKEQVRAAKKVSERKDSPREKDERTKSEYIVRTERGRVPQGRTLKTFDNFLKGSETGSTKERPVVVIEANDQNDPVIVPFSSKAGKNRTRLKNYQQGQSYFKHFVEIEDDEDLPIRIGKKFQENHPNMDVSSEDVEFIKDKVFNRSKSKQGNQKKIDKFRNKKNP